MENLPFLEHNKATLEKLQAIKPTEKLQERATDNPRGFEIDMRVVGVKCARCGGRITVRNLEFFAFMPEVKCYQCTREPELTEEEFFKKADEAVDTFTNA